MEKGTIFITCYTYDPPVCMLSIDQEFMVLLQLISLEWADKIVVTFKAW